MLKDTCDANGLGKVLLIASFAECPRVWRMASTLAKSGFEVTVLEWDRSSQLPATEYTKNVRVYRMKLRAPYGLRLFLELPLWWIYISLFLLSNRFAIIQPQNLDSLLPSWVICRVKRIKIVYDIADFYADAYIPSSMVLLRKATAWLERTLIKTVDATIVVDESRLRQIHLDSLPFFVIYNSPPDIYNELKSNVRMQEASDSKLTLFYAGILERDRGLDLLIEAVQDLPDVELVVAGFGRMEKEFSNLIKGKRNVKFLSRIPYNAVLKLTLSCDCVIALYDPHVPNNVFASPNKLFEAMMCGKPIIVSDGTAMSNIVLREKCGLVVKYGNVNELKRSIGTLKNNRNLATSLGRSGRNAYLKKYNWHLMEKRLLQLYDSIF